MTDLPKSMKLFVFMLILLVILVPLGLYYTNKSTVDTSNDEYLTVKYSENITEKDLEALDNKETPPTVIQGIVRKTEQSFDTRDKGTLLENYVKKEIPEKTLKKDRLIFVSFNKMSSNVSEVREIINNIKLKKLNGELKIFYTNIPESNIEKSRISRVISSEFKPNDDINSLGVELITFSDITILDKGKITYQTDDLSELTNRKNKEIYK